MCHLLTRMKFLWLPCLLWLLVACSGSTGSRAMLSRDGLALLEFKSHIIDPYARLSDWKDTDKTPCWWSGVTCVPSGAAAAANDSVVSALILTADRLEGSVSGSLGSLANLTRLELSENMLEGAIPQEIVNCKLLTYLKLYSNRASNGTGGLPANLSQLRRLEYLNVAFSALGGPIPALGGLTNLAFLDLRWNGFGGDVDAIGLSKLTRLEVLMLDGNRFLTGSLPNLSGLRNLRVLSFNGTLTGGKVPDYLSASQDLVELRMRAAQLEGPLPTWIGNLPHLTTLDLSLNNFSGEIPPGMWSNSTFESVNLSGNRISGAIPGDFLQHFRKATQTRGTEEGYSNLLNLSGNRLTGSIPANGIDGSVFLYHLDLSNNELDGPIPTWIASSSVLLLGNNSLSGDIASVWCNVSQYRRALHVLELQGNQLSGNVAAATCARWEGLILLDLSHNAGVNLVNDSLGIMLSNFSKLQELRLSNIGSAGRLPPTARVRASQDALLRILDLSHSNLTGDLSIFANASFLFPQLQSLNLSGNRLTGQIPLGLAILPSIRVLDLSNNRLSGPLPPFPPHLLNASFFAGNPGLCGLPLKPCS